MMGNFGCAKMAKSQKKRHLLLLFILVSVRKLIEILQRWADRLEHYIESAGKDTEEITGKIELNNTVKMLTGLTILAVIASLTLTGWIESFVSGLQTLDLYVLIFSFILLAGNLFYFAWQIILAFHYRPFDEVTDDQLPHCAVIVPAYNEGKQVVLTLDSLLKSDYPPSKMEIIAVNDGSCDDTWDWISKSVKSSNGRIRAVNLRQNAGKRNALYQGFLSSEAEIVVTIDSDSIVLPDTVRKIVAPFIGHPKTGGVAGNIRVLNFSDGIIPRMLDVNFVFSFEFLRSAQSMIHSVFCTPGALSAYRRGVIMPFMEEWVNQKFMGRPANIGEDRAISNIILREGYHVVFQKSAFVYTEVPKCYGGLCKMFIRWSRSNVRENLEMFKFAFGRIDFTDEDLLGMQINLIMQTLWTLTPMLFVASTIYCLVVSPLTFLYASIMATLIWSTLPAFVYASKYSKKDALWSYVYGVFNFLSLSWIGPYSILTIHRSGWLTRSKPKKDTESVIELAKENAVITK